MKYNIDRVRQVNLEAAQREAENYVSIKPHETNLTDLLRCAELLGRIEALDTSGKQTDLVARLRALIREMRFELAAQ
jgi:hypothetical protein